MPTISMFFGCVVQMYWRDHPPPHIHVLYQGFEALFAIETAEVIEALDLIVQESRKATPRKG